jgi:hypothetical protein
MIVMPMSCWVRSMGELRWENFDGDSDNVDLKDPQALREALLGSGVRPEAVPAVACA